MRAVLKACHYNSGGKATVRACSLLKPCKSSTEYQNLVRIAIDVAWIWSERYSAFFQFLMRERLSHLQHGIVKARLCDFVAFYFSDAVIPYCVKILAITPTSKGGSPYCFPICRCNLTARLEPCMTKKRYHILGAFGTHAQFQRRKNGVEPTSNKRSIPKGAT